MARGFFCLIAADLRGLVQAALHNLLEAEDLHNMFSWLEGLIKNPFSEQENAPVIAGSACDSAPCVLS